MWRQTSLQGSVVSIQPRETEFTTTRGGEHLLLGRSSTTQAINYSSLHHRGSIPRGGKHRQTGCAMHPSSDRRATTAERNVEPDGMGPTDKQQQRAHRHGEIPQGRPDWAWGEKCTRTRRGDTYAQGNEVRVGILGIGAIVQQGAIWRNTTAGQWARIHLQMESSLFVWARFQERRKGPKKRGESRAGI